MPYTYGMLKATYFSRDDVRLEKIPVMRRTLFCRRSSFKMWVSAANFLAGQA